MITNVDETADQSEKSSPHYANEGHYGAPGKDADWPNNTRTNSPAEQPLDRSKILERSPTQFLRRSNGKDCKFCYNRNFHYFPIL